MKRILALALCLLMIVGALASCKPSDGDVVADTTTPAETEPPVNNVDIDLGSYVFIRPESTSAALLASAVQLRKDLEAAAGTTIKMDVDWLKPGTEADDAAYEILVGNTNRKQTAAALEKLLKEQGVDCRPHRWMEDCLVLSGTGNLEQLEAFRQEAQTKVDFLLAQIALRDQALAHKDKTIDGLMDLLRK